jgi:valyl-tRNA synthetase
MVNWCPVSLTALSDEEVEMRPTKGFIYQLRYELVEPTTTKDAEGNVIPLTHLVLDNEAHDSTGGQGTVSRGVALAAVAQACGYRHVISTDAPAELEMALKNPLNLF